MSKQVKNIGEAKTVGEIIAILSQYSAETLITGALFQDGIQVNEIVLNNTSYLSIEDV